MPATAVMGKKAFSSPRHPKRRENCHEADGQAHSGHYGIVVSGSGPGRWRRLRSDRQGLRRNLDARFRRKRAGREQDRHVRSKSERHPDSGSNGRYVIAFSRADLPKVASNNRTTATAEENKAIVGGSLAHFGTVSVNATDKTFTFK